MKGLGVKGVMTKKKVLLIDLDGVLNEYKGNFNPEIIPPIKSGAKEFLIELTKNFELKLFTTRPKELASVWVKKYELETFFSEITNEKSPAWLIIDDRCLTFDGDYASMLEKIFEFKTWYKK